MDTNNQYTVATVNPDRKRTIQEDFITYHRANPGIYDELVKYARFAKSKGYDRLGIALIWERLRWYVYVEAVDKGQAPDYKFPNDYRSRYARLIMANEPDLTDFFSIRALRTL